MERHIWVKEKKDGGVSAGCHSCARRKRRGAVVDFNRSQGVSVANWKKRHVKHGMKR